MARENGDNRDTRSERREKRRRRARDMKVSGKGFINAIRNAVRKRAERPEKKDGKKR